VKRGEGNTNSPELPLLKNLLPSQPFLAATFYFTSFFTMAVLGPHTFFTAGLDLKPTG